MHACFAACADYALQHLFVCLGCKCSDPLCASVASSGSPDHRPRHFSSEEMVPMPNHLSCREPESGKEPESGGRRKRPKSGSRRKRPKSGSRVAVEGNVEVASDFKEKPVVCMPEVLPPPNPGAGRVKSELDFSYQYKAPADRIEESFDKMSALELGCEVVEPDAIWKSTGWGFAFDLLARQIARRSESARAYVSNALISYSRFNCLPLEFVDIERVRNTSAGIEGWAYARIGDWDADAPSFMESPSATRSSEELRPTADDGTQGEHSNFKTLPDSQQTPIEIA